jgi:nucleotide-binding universal stress UspA family protein
VLAAVTRGTGFTTDPTSRSRLPYDRGQPKQKGIRLNILVATDGTLDPERAADAVARSHVDGDQVTVFTAMSVPTEFLRGLGNSGVAEASQIAREAGQTLFAGDRAAERLAGSMTQKTAAKSDSPFLHAMATAAGERTKPIVDALKERGIQVKATWQGTEAKTANTILAKLKEIDADLLIIGSHGRGQFEGRLGSTGTKLVRLSPASVFVIRKPTEGAKS